MVWPWDSLRTEDTVKGIPWSLWQPWDREKGLEKRNTFVFTQPELLESSLSQHWFVCMHGELQMTPFVTF